MSSFVRFPSAAAIVALLLGVGVPARAGAAEADDETGAPAIELPAAPPPRQPTSDDDDDAPTLVPHRVHRVRPGLIVAGAVTYLASYAPAVFLGLATVGSGAVDSCDDCRSHGAMAAVPIAGPLLYWWKAPADKRGSPVFWSVWSGVEAVGAGMLIAGTVGHNVLERRPRHYGAAVHIVPTIAPKVGALSLAVTW